VIITEFGNLLLLLVVVVVLVLLPKTVVLYDAYVFGWMELYAWGNERDFLLNVRWTVNRSGLTRAKSRERIYGHGYNLRCTLSYLRTDQHAGHRRMYLRPSVTWTFSV